jgi:hypothetical protein
MANDYSIYDVITKEWLQNTFLMGVDLTLDDGSPFSDMAFKLAVETSIRHIEQDIGINIVPFSTVQEKHDAELQNRLSYWPFRLDCRPLISLDQIRIRLGSFQPVEIPNSWARIVAPMHGQLHLIPSQESISSYFFQSGMPILGNFNIYYEAKSYIPGYFEFSYTAGFESRKGSVTIPAGQTEARVTLSPMVLMKYSVTLTPPTGVTAKTFAFGQEGFSVSIPQARSEDTTITYFLDTLPSNIKHMIGLKSACNFILQVAGDLILGAGIASSSIGIDGLSQSIQTTSSAMYSGYSSRIDYYEKQYEALRAAVKAEYRITSFGAI